MKNIHSKGWLREDNRIEESGEMKSFLFCAWYCETNKSNQMTEGILFSIDNKICKTFSSTRLQEQEKKSSLKINQYFYFLKEFFITSARVSSKNFQIRSIFIISKIIMNIFN